jgi:hypothetical protein
MLAGAYLPFALTVVATPRYSNIAESSAGESGRRRRLVPALVPVSVPVSVPVLVPVLVPVRADAATADAGRFSAEIRHIRSTPLAARRMPAHIAA